jgi:NADPH2:quinone reductase
MRAFVIHDVSRPPQLEDFREPVESGQHVPMRVVAAAVNPIDLAMASGEMASGLPLPRVAGIQAIVDHDGRLGFTSATMPPFGTFAERTLVDPGVVLPLPDGLSPATALVVGGGVSGWLPLERTANLQAGETVLVLGATGLTGQVAVQAAKLLGAGRVVAAGRHEPTLTTLLGRGADAIVVMGGADDAEALRDATAGGADVIFDPVFGNFLSTALTVLKRGGRSVSLGFLAGTETTVSFWALLGKSMLTHVGFQVPGEVQSATFLRLANHVMAGEVVVDTEVLPLERMGEAWQRQANSPHCKLVIEP